VIGPPSGRVAGISEWEELPIEDMHAEDYTAIAPRLVPQIRKPFYTRGHVAGSHDWLSRSETITFLLGERMLTANPPAVIL